MKRLIVFLVLALAVSCASKAPPDLTPTGVRYWQGNEAVVAIGTFQHAAIELNKLQVCDPAPCHPLLSDKNTGVVVDGVTVTLTTMRAAPAGWRATALAFLDQVVVKLDEAGRTKLAGYVLAARAVINAIP